MIARTKDEQFMRQALRLAARAYGQTSPNPMVGALLVRNGKVIGAGWHHRAGLAHAEIEALADVARRLKTSDYRKATQGATLYVSLEPCCTHGRTPPCTDAILAAKIARVVVGATDPNPRHAGRGLKLLEAAGVSVTAGTLAEKATQLNEAFNHWIVERTPFVTVKAAMSLDGKIATRTGESKWITGPQSRAHAMRLREGADAILVGVKTILADDPQLTWRAGAESSQLKRSRPAKQLRRIVLDRKARTPLDARVLADHDPAQTVIVVGEEAPERRLKALRKRATIWVAPTGEEGVDLRWLMQRLGQENVLSLLVEGGGQVNASFLFSGLVQRLVFFYAPKIIGGAQAIKGVGGAGVCSLSDSLRLREVQWRRAGADLILSARVGAGQSEEPN